MHIYQWQIQEFLQMVQSACQADWCRHEDTEQATGSAPSCRSSFLATQAFFEAIAFTVGFHNVATMIEPI